MATINWTNPAGGAWFSKGNWDLGRNPQAGDDVTIGLAGNYTVTVEPKPGSTGFGLPFNTLTISDPNATVVIQGNLAASIQGDITNDGTLTFNTIPTNTTVFGSITNHGTLNLRNLTVEGAVTNSDTVTFSGTVDLFGSGIAQIFSAGTVKVFGTLDLGGGGDMLTSLGPGLNLTFEGNVTENGDENPFATLSSNAGNLIVGDGASFGNSAVAFTNSGTEAVVDGIISTDQTFTNSGTLSFDAGSGLGGSQFSVAHAFSNSATFTFGNAALSAADTATVQTMSNTGAISIIGSASHLAALIDLGDSAPTTLSGASFRLAGDALLQYQSGGITAIASNAELSIDGTKAFVAFHGHTTKNSALTGLDSNAGTLMLGDGVVLGNAALAFTNTGTYTAFDHTLVKTNLDFSNSGTLNVDAASGQGGSALNVAGTFSNDGTFAFGNSAMSAADLSVVTTLSNTGTIDIAGGSASDMATLKVKGDATNSGTVDISAFGSLTKAHGYTQTAGETDLAGAINLPDTFIQGGILQGTGKDTGSVVVTGGGIAGGDFATATLGTLSIKGKLVDSAEVDATLVAAGSGAASEIDVSGSKVSLKDGTLHLNITDPANLHAGETFTVLTFTPDVLTFGFSHMTDGTHTGDGNSLDLGNGFTLDAAYDNAGGDIMLTVVDTPAHAEAAMPHHMPIIDWA